MKRDIPREHLGEFIEEALAEGKNNKEDYLDGADIRLEGDGHVSITLHNSNNAPTYDIRVTRRSR